MIGATAEARDHGQHLGRTARQRGVEVGGEDPAGADREGPLQDDHPLGLVERRAQLACGKRSEALQRDRPDRLPALAQLVDDLDQRAEDGSQRHDHGLRVGAVVVLEQPARAAPESAAEVGGDARDQLERLQLLGVREVAHLGERLGAHHRADRHRLVRVEHLARGELGQEVIDLAPVRAPRAARRRG